MNISRKQNEKWRDSKIERTDLGLLNQVKTRHEGRKKKKSIHAREKIWMERLMEDVGKG